MNKSDFPIFKNNSGLVYLDSAATSQKPQMVIDAIKEYYEKYNANVHRGIYDLSEKATEFYEATRIKVAKFINAKSSREIIFVRNTTEAINLVSRTWAKENIKRKDEILISQMEHNSNLIPWQQIADEYNISLKYINTKDFKLDKEDLITKLRQLKPALVALTHFSNSIGTINPIKEITKEVHNNGGVILIDGAQSVPHLKVDVQDMNVDFLAFSGHKMFGPTGIGVLYVKESLLANMQPFLTGGGMVKAVDDYTTEFVDFPQKFEAGTPDIAGVFGLSAAIDYLESIGMDKIEQYEKKLTAYTLGELSKFPEVNILGTNNLIERGGVISFLLKNVHPHDIAQVLNENNIAVRAGNHCNHLLMKKVLQVPATTRVSLHIYNDESDIDKLVEGLKKVIKLFL